MHIDGAAPALVVSALALVAGFLGRDYLRDLFRDALSTVYTGRVKPVLGGDALPEPGPTDAKDGGAPSAHEGSGSDELSFLARAKIDVHHNRIVAIGHNAVAGDKEASINNVDGVSQEPAKRRRRRRA